MNQTIKSIFYFPVSKIIIAITFCFALFLGVQNFISKPIFYSLISSKEIGTTIINYISVIVLLLTYYFLFHFYDKRKITELSIKHFPKDFIGGLIFGFSTLSLVILILYFGGSYKVIGISNYSFLIAPLSSLVIAALLEEVFFRLIIYRILETWIGTYWTLPLISIVFTIPHLFNDNVSLLSVLILLIFGFAHSIMYNYTKRLWLPFAFHLGWNFAQPFYGSNLSGLEDVGSIIKAKFEGPKMLIGSNFGIEDSILSIILLAIISFIFLTLSIREGKIIRRTKLK